MIKAKQQPCPNQENHTLHPEGYLQFLDWAEKMAKTHKQTKCKGCGLWAIWVPKKELIRFESKESKWIKAKQIEWQDGFYIKGTINGRHIATINTTADQRYIVSSDYFGGEILNSLQEAKEYAQISEVKEGI